VLHTRFGDLKFNPGQRISLRSPGIENLLGHRPHCIVFPTAVAQSDDVTIAEIAYGVFAFSPFLLRFCERVSNTTFDGHVVYGALADGPFPPTGCDLVVLPVVVSSHDIEIYACEAPIGHSADLAIRLSSADMPVRTFTPKVLFTGTVSGSCIGKVLLVEYKRKLVSDGWVIAGGTAGVPGTIPLSTLADANKLISQSAKLY
jgi:hypothetical protein